MTVRQIGGLHNYIAPSWLKLGINLYRDSR